jgi:hypothetical protein
MLNQNMSLQNNNLNNLVNLMKGAKNPQALIQQIATQNPQMRTILNMVQNNGRNPKDLFYDIAKQKGVNPDDILNLLK